MKVGSISWDSSDDLPVASPTQTAARDRDLPDGWMAVLHHSEQVVGAAVATDGGQWSHMDSGMAGSLSKIHMKRIRHVSALAKRGR